MSSPELPRQWWREDPDSLARLAPLQTVLWPPLQERGIRFSIKREDLLDPYLGGNKFYKLLGHLQVVLDSGADAIASFGGAWSNHLYALAAAGQALNIPTIAVIRGEKPIRLSPTLRDVQRFGMELHFISRRAYREKDTVGLTATLREKLDLERIAWVPEGGSGELGMSGCEALGRALVTPETPTTVCAAVGTGTTLAGLIRGVAVVPTTFDTELLGISVLKGQNTLTDEIWAMLNSGVPKSDPLPRWRIETGFHCGGYARYPEVLRDFVREFTGETGIPLDPVYTAKLFYGITCLAEAGYWHSGDHVVAVHSGGLQGARTLTYEND